MLEIARLRLYTLSGLRGPFTGRLPSRMAACVAAALAMQVPQAFAQTDSAVGDFYARLVRGVEGVAGKSGGAAVAACVQFFRSVADTDAFVRATAQGTWQKMTTAQRSAYRNAIEQKVAGDCARESGGAGGAVSLGGVQPGGGSDRLVTIYLKQPNGGGLTTVWRVRAASSGAELRAVDLIVDGRSAVSSLRDKTNAALARSSGNIDTMIGAMGR
jgi:hypothetical protein